MENMKIINFNTTKNLNDQIKELNLAEKTFAHSRNLFEFKNIASNDLNAVFNLKLKPLIKESHDNYLNLEIIMNELNQLNNEILQIKREIEYLENNVKGSNDDYVNNNFNLPKLEKQKQYLQKNLKIIQKSLNENQKEYIFIKNNISSIRESLKEETLKTNLELKGIIFTESSKMFTLELELTHLRREENSYFKKIEDINRIIKLNTLNNSDKNNNNSEIKEKLILLQKKLAEKEKIIKKHEITRINSEILMKQIKRKLLNFK